jgi:hypothetical protein
MLYYLPRTLALVVGLAGPAAGFGSFKDGGGTLIEVSTESAGAGYVSPRLLCCPGGVYPPDDANGDLSPECEAYAFPGQVPWRNDAPADIDSWGNAVLPPGSLTTFPISIDCLPADLCKRIGVDKGLNVAGGTIQEGDDWCNAAVSKITDNEDKRRACSGGNILRKQKNVMTKNGDGVEFLICSWDSTTDRCVLAGWAQYCAVNEESGTPKGCPGVDPLPENRDGRAGVTNNVIVASKCSNKMEKSQLSFSSSGRPRYTLAQSCEQKLLDCGTAAGVKDHFGIANLTVSQEAYDLCNPTKGVVWCARAFMRLRL